MTEEAEGGRVLASSLDYEATLASVAGLAIPSFADWASVDVLDESGAVRRVAIMHSDPQKVAMAYEVTRRYPPTDDDAERIALRTGESAPVQASVESA